jgi:hypothetical protein
MVNKSGTVSANCVLFNTFFVYRTLNTNKKVKYKNFLLEVGRSWISEVQNRCESNSDSQMPEKQTPPKEPIKDLPGRLSGDFRIHELENMFAGGERNKKYLARQCTIH